MTDGPDLPQPVDPERCAEALALLKSDPLQLTEKHFEQFRLISAGTETDARDKQRTAQLALVAKHAAPQPKATAGDRGEQLADVIEGIIRKNIAAVMTRVVALERLAALDIDPANPDSLAQLADALRRSGLTDDAVADVQSWIRERFPLVPPPASTGDDRPRVH